MHEDENKNLVINDNDMDIDTDSDSDTDNDESKDFSRDVNKDEFNIKNIDFEELRENLNNNVYTDGKLTANAINHIRKNINSSTEVQCETKGMKNKISITTKGDRNRVDLSNFLILRAKKGEKTLQILHNHTSGKPLPHSEDMINMLKYKIENSGIVGNYGYLNMKNSFKELNETDLYKLQNKANKMYDDLKNEAFKNNPYMKFESEKVRNTVTYKYNKENIDNIIKKYNNEFKEFGIRFKYTHYKLQKR